MDNNEQERQEFEAWHGGLYRGYQAEIAWTAWQNSRKSAQSCAGCSKPAGEGWALYCVTCAEQIAAPSQPADPTAAVWRCFHCDEVFTTAGSAADHFGSYQGATPGCVIDKVALEDGGKHLRGRGLLMELRKVEAELQRYREEDTDLHREIHRLHAAHHTALQREEEKGYARGLADAHLLPAEPASHDAQSDFQDWYTGISIEGDMKHNMERAWQAALSRTSDRDAIRDAADWMDEAADEIESWGSYASPYFQEKHDLAESVQRFRDRAAAIRALTAAIKDQP